MLQTLRTARATYPRQFWLMFFGMLLSTVGSSMIWPFLMIYASERLRMPLASVAGLMTLSSAMGLASSFVAGPVVDRLGRKWVMVISLVVNAAMYLVMSRAETLPAFALVMAVNGAFNPLYRVGADAMLADLIPPAGRADAYALMRMSNNAGIAIGPSIGGLVAQSSYAFAFYGAAAGMSLYGLLIALFAHETLPRLLATEQDTRTPSGERSGGVSRSLASTRQPAEASTPTNSEVRRSGGVSRFFRLGSQPAEASTPDDGAGRPAGHRAGAGLGGYGEIFADRMYIAFLVAVILVIIGAALIWVLMAVYAKQNFGLPESQFGLIASTNAVMVVLFQVLVTRATRRYPPLKVVAVGGFIYAVSVGAVALANGFWGFWIVMVVMTIGELIIVPTSSTFAANRSGVDNRGRYMSLYGLTWGISSGIGPVFGGLLNDNLGPRWIWIGGFVVGMAGVLALLVLARRDRTQGREAALA